MIFYFPVNSRFGFDEGPVLKILKGLAQFLFSVHDDGPIPGNRLFWVRKCLHPLRVKTLYIEPINSRGMEDAIGFLHEMGMNCFAEKSYPHLRR